MTFKSYTLDTEGIQRWVGTIPFRLSTVTCYSCNFHRK